MHYPFYRSGNDIIVHLRWNALHKCGGKQSGDVDWSIITKPHPLSTQEVRLRHQSIRNMMSYLTILVLESLPNVTPRHCPRSLINLMGSLYKEAQSDEVSKCKSPWQQRQPCKRTTYILSQSILSTWKKQKSKSKDMVDAGKVLETKQNHESFHPMWRGHCIFGLVK